MTDLPRLIRQARAGDHEAFSEIYDRHARLVRAIAYDATGELGAAEDVAQETFLKAFRKLHQLRGEDRFVPWLAGIARRTAFTWRRGKRRDRHEFGPAAPETLAADGDGGMLEELRAAIRRLPSRERLALHIFYLDEQPAETARAALGLSSSGFYKLIERARQRAATIMRENEETRK